MEQINLHSLILMVGPSGAGKSTVINSLFDDSEVVSSDGIRSELLGDFRIQSNQDDVWAEVHRRVRQKLAFGQRAVVDATNLRFRDRKPFIEMAKHFGVELIYIVVNRALVDKLASGGWRLGVPGLIEKHDETFRNNQRDIMKGDGVARVFDFTGGDFPVNVVQHVNDPVSNHNGWFDDGVMVIGDVHGNFDELTPMVMEANLRDQNILFLGDIIDYGDHNLAVMDLVYDLVRKGKARMIWGNHERKITRWVDADFGRGFKGMIFAGMAKTVDEITVAAQRDPSFEDRFKARWRMLHSNSRQHFVYREWLFTHGAATKEMWNLQGHSLPGFHGNMAFFGEVDETKPMRDDGYPNRTYGWIANVPKNHTVVVGHDHRDKSQPMMVTNDVGGRAIFLDTGSSKGGKLSCMTV